MNLTSLGLNLFKFIICDVLKPIYLYLYLFILTDIFHLNYELIYLVLMACDDSILFINYIDL